MSFTISSSSSQYPMIDQLNQVEQQLRNARNVKNRDYCELSVKPSDLKSTEEGDEKATEFLEKVKVDEATEVLKKIDNPFSSETWENSSAQGDDFQDQELETFILLLRYIQNAKKSIQALNCQQIDTPRNRIALKKRLENIKENIGKLPEDPNISLPLKIVRGLNNLYIALNNEYKEVAKLLIGGALLVIGIALKMLVSWPFAMISLVAVLCSCVLLRGSIDRRSEKITQQIADCEYKVVIKQGLSEMVGTDKKIANTVTQLMNQATEQKKQVTQAKEAFEAQIKQFHNSDKASRLEKGKLITALRKSIDAWQPIKEELVDNATALLSGETTAFLAKINDPFEKYGGAEDRAGKLKAAKDVVIFLQRKLHTIRSKDSQALIHTLDQVMATAENELDKLNQRAVDAASQRLHKEIAGINQSFNKDRKSHLSKFKEPESSKSTIQLA